MHYFLYLLKRYRVFLLFLLLEGVALSLYFSTDPYQRARVGLLLSSHRLWIAERVNGLTDYFRLGQINAQFTRENAYLREQLEILQMQRGEGLSAGQAEEFERFHAIAARVVTNSVARQHNFFSINRGANDGVRPQMAVVTPSSVAGVVVAVTAHYASAISLLNRDLKISARLARTGHFGSLYWDGSSIDRAVLDHMPHHVQVRPGDTVETSGYSSIFPLGIPIGVVESVAQQGGAFLQIQVRLITDFQSLHSLYVLKDRRAEEMDSINAATRGGSNDE